MMFDVDSQWLMRKEQSWFTVVSSNVVSLKCDVFRLLYNVYALFMMKVPPKVWLVSPFVSSNSPLIKLAGCFATFHFAITPEYLCSVVRKRWDDEKTLKSVSLYLCVRVCARVCMCVSICGCCHLLTCVCVRLCISVTVLPWQSCCHLVPTLW